MRLPMTDDLRARVHELIGDGDPAERVGQAFDAVQSIDDPAIFISTVDSASVTVEADAPLAG